MSISKEQALTYHLGGKIVVEPSKPLKTQEDLATAYTPGVAIPCLEIEADEAKAYDYTSKSNLVAVISNGTAVLGLGDIGALASKPVMEGKAVLFKSFSKIDAIDIEVDEKDPDKFVSHVKSIAKTFGGINLEDIKAPECFYIEDRLKKETDIPVFHDDQHGTAIISTAALINGLELTGKRADEITVVISGAGAAAIASAKMYKYMGVNRIILVDSKGIVSKTREDLNKYKQEFAIDTVKQTLEEALHGADMVVGLSRPGIITAEMVKSMAPNPMIFALSNPTPEIMPDIVKAAREDAIVATGRSDFNNQVNNVLGFPYIFRGALDVQARIINESMKMAAARALAKLAKEPITDRVREVYGDLSFGQDYIIPTPFDERLIYTVSSEVAKAAIETGVARKQIDIEEYIQKLKG
jgi:malic enzyme